MTEPINREGAFWNNWKNTAIPSVGTTISSPNASGAYAGYKGSQGAGNVAVDPFVADLFQMAPEEIFKVSVLLKNAGYLRNTTRKYNKTLGDAYTNASMDWSNESARTGRPNLTFRSFLLENVSAPTGGAAARNLPTRQVYAVTEDQIAADIADITMKTLGREIVDADKEADWYKDLVKGINKLYQKGTVTEVKKTKNPKTGKMEQVVTQTPGFSQEQIQQKITGAVEAADPATLERKKNLEFANWAFEKMGGRG